MTGPQPGETVYVVDANNIVHRLYHAVPQQVSPTGQPVNAVVGWIRNVRSLRKRGARWVLPIFDAPGPSWRHEIYSAYKSDRSEDDPELATQWPIVVRACFALGLPALAAKGFEADDLIAAYTEAMAARGCQVVICSNDKDLLQLVRGDEGEPGCVRLLAKGNDGLELRGPEYVRERYGVEPERLGDLLALSGDSSDGVPGVRGIGPKTAARVIAQHGDLEQVLDRWMLTPGKTAERLRDGAEEARLSRRLVELRSDAPLPLPIDEVPVVRPSRARLDELFRPLGYPRWESAVDAYGGQA